MTTTTSSKGQQAAAFTCVVTLDNGAQWCYNSPNLVELSCWVSAQLDQFITYDVVSVDYFIRGELVSSEYPTPKGWVVR